MADELITQWFMREFSGENPMLGRIDNADATADSPGCRGDRDHLFLYLKIDGTRIVDVKFECAVCDPAMLVTGDILCRLVKGMLTNDAMDISASEFLQLLGGDSQELVEHTTPALKILRTALLGYEAMQHTSV